MKERLLNERQFNAVNQIIELCTRINPDHWFTTAELYKVGSGTLKALEKRGYVRYRRFFDDEHTGFRCSLEHWQWTGKTIDNKLEQVQRIIAGYKKQLAIFESKRYGFGLSGDIHYCEGKLSFWKDIEKEIIDQGGNVL